MHFSFFDLIWETSTAPPLQPYSDHSPRHIPGDSSPDLISVPQTPFSLPYSSLCLSRSPFLLHIVTLPLNQVQIIFQAPA